MNIRDMYVSKYLRVVSKYDAMHSKDMLEVLMNYHGMSSVDDVVKMHRYILMYDKLPEEIKNSLDNYIRRSYILILAYFKGYTVVDLENRTIPQITRDKYLDAIERTMGWKKQLI